jgi:hypothetical protein
MIQDRHGTLTAPRRDNGTQTKKETDQLWSSIGFTSLSHRARLMAVSAPETNARASFPKVFRGSNDC